MMSAHLQHILLGVCSLTLIATFARQSLAGDAASAKDASAIRYETVNIDGVDIFYREAGPVDAPAVVLLHGFPTSSFMFRNLIPKLAPHYHVIAPDYPGFGQSSCPDHEKFHYTFDHLTNIVDQFTTALKLKKFALYVQDYGAPIGYRLSVSPLPAQKHINVI